MACFAGGTLSILLVESMGAEYTISVVFGFGGCFLLSNVWKSLSRQGFVVGIAFAMTLAFLAQYVPRNLLYEYFDINYSLNFYVAWIALNFIIGVPVMMIIFNKFKE